LYFHISQNFDIDWKSVVNDNLLTMNVPDDG
jgi:hypothetical protein